LESELLPSGRGLRGHRGRRSVFSKKAWQISERGEVVGSFAREGLTGRTPPGRATWLLRGEARRAAREARIPHEPPGPDIAFTSRVPSRSSLLLQALHRGEGLETPSGRQEPGAQGACATFDILGEFIDRPEEARENTDAL